MTTRQPKSYSIDKTFPEIINSIWRKDEKFDSASEWVNYVLEQAIQKEFKRKSKPKTRKKG